MTLAELIETIQRLPPADQAEIEAMVRARAERHSHPEPGAPRFAKEVLDRIDARREQLARDGVVIDSSETIRAFREGRP